MHKDDILYGRNALQEALDAGRTINDVYYLESGDRRLRDLVDQAKEQGAVIHHAKREQLDRMAKGDNHQGVVVELSPKDYVDAETYLAELMDIKPEPFILLLDEIQDGHNLGAILRVADAAGVDLVIIPERRAQALDSRVAHASAGAVEYVPVARVTNMTDCVLKLKDMGFWIYGLAGEAEQEYTEINYSGALGLMIGNEGKGIGVKLRDHLDGLLKIPMLGHVNSLNASVAAGIVTFEAVKQRRKK